MPLPRPLPQPYVEGPALAPPRSQPPRTQPPQSQATLEPPNLNVDDAPPPVIAIAPQPTTPRTHVVSRESNPPRPNATPERRVIPVAPPRRTSRSVPQPRPRVTEEPRQPYHLVPDLSPSRRHESEDEDEDRADPPITIAERQSPPNAAFVPRRTSTPDIAPPASAVRRDPPSWREPPDIPSRRGVVTPPISQAEETIERGSRESPAPPAASNTAATDNPSSPTGPPSTTPPQGPVIVDVVPPASAVRRDPPSWRAPPEIPSRRVVTPPPPRGAENSSANSNAAPAQGAVRPEPPPRRDAPETARRRDVGAPAPPSAAREPRWVRRDPRDQLRRISPAIVPGHTPDGIGPFGEEDDRQDALAQSADVDEIDVPDVDTANPDEQIIVAQPQPAQEEERPAEPVAPAQIHDPREVRIEPMDNTLTRCPPCEEDCMCFHLPPCCPSPVRRTPEMFGDVFLASQCYGEGVDGGFLVSFPGMSLGQKIADNNNPLPRHRVYYTFNYFQDAVDYAFTSDDELNERGQEDLRRHTLGIELPFCCENFSVELRVPMEHRIDQRRFTEGGEFSYGFGGFGNVLLVTKALLGECDCFAWSMGLGIELPTGRDATAGTDQLTFNVENEAVHLHPYLAFVWTPTCKLFFESFTQLDVTTKGNRVTAFDLNSESTQFLGNTHTPHLLFVDAAAGYWLYCDDPCRRFSSLAAMAEVHYVTAVEDGEPLEATLGVDDYFLCDGVVHHGGIDVVNLTLGLHAECGPCKSLRIAGAFPITDSQLFSSELILQFNRRR